MKKLFILMFFLWLAIAGSRAENNDGGLQISAEATHKINRRLTLSVEGELRTRNNFRTMDRWSIEVDGAYKLCSHARIGAGYTFLYDNNIEKIDRDDFGMVSRWRPSYWGVRHRFNVSLTGSLGLGRLTFSLRERWQYTYRPEKTTDCYDFHNDLWEDRQIRGKGKNLLRSRLRVEYNVAGSKIDPYISSEFFNSSHLEKTRMIVGADWKIIKNHVLSVFYRHQWVNRDDDNEPDMSIIGISYKFKF